MHFVLILMHLEYNATSDWMTLRICDTTCIFFDFLSKTRSHYILSLFNGWLSGFTLLAALPCCAEQCSFKGENVKKCIRMGITVHNVSFGEVNRLFYGRKLHFTVPLMCCGKTEFPTIKPTTYSPNDTFEYSYPLNDWTNFSHLMTKPTNRMCTLRRLRSAWANFAQADQSLCMCSVGSRGPKVSSCGHRRLWSDWADAQADLSLRWAQRSFSWFCHEAAHLFYKWIRMVS